MEDRASIQKDIKFEFKGFTLLSKSLDSFKENLSEFEHNVIGFAREWLSGKSTFEFQTSGSTGTPQKIKFTREQIIASAELTRKAFLLENHQRALLCLDPGFIAGKMMIVRALEIGMDLLCIPPSANPLNNWDDNSPIDFAALVPYQLNEILNSPAAIKKFSRIKKVIVGGSSVSENLIQKLQPLTAQFLETYGMTETLTHIAIRKLNPPENAFHTLKDIKVFLDERECLNIQAPHISPDPIPTNDVAEIISDGVFKVIGRYDNIINTGGAKVSPEEVERKIGTILSSHLGKHEYFIGGIKDNSFGERVALFVEADGMPGNLKQHLIEHLQPVLTKFEFPKEIITIPAFKRTASGKINRKESIRHVLM